MAVMSHELPMGFHFNPNDNELICYLHNKVTKPNYICSVVFDINLSNIYPWELPAEASIENKWYCYWVPQRKYTTGRRFDRSIKSGHWKSTGKKEKIYNSETNLIGTKKAFVFYHDKAVKGVVKTNWFMLEYRLPDTISNAQGWVLSRVFEKDTGESTKFSSSSLSPISGSSSNINHFNNPGTGGDYAHPITLHDTAPPWFERSNFETGAFGLGHPTSADLPSLLPETLPPNYNDYSNISHVNNPEIGGSDHPTLGDFGPLLFINEDYSSLIEWSNLQTAPVVHPTSDDLSALPPTTLNGYEREDDICDMNWDTIF